MVSIHPIPAAPGFAGGSATPDDRRAFARFVTELFSRRRKQLGTIFGRDRTWPEGVEQTMRPETLSIRQLMELWRS